MTNLRRLDVIRIFALSALLLTCSAISWAQQRPPIADKMAKAQGPRLFRASRGNPLHLQCGTSQRQRFPQLGMEPEDRLGLL